MRSDTALPTRRQHLSAHTSSSNMVCHLIERCCLKYNYITHRKHVCSASTAPDVCMCMCMCMYVCMYVCVWSRTHVFKHVTCVLPLIERTSNGRHQCVIDILSLFLLLMLSLDGTTGLLEAWCVFVHVCDGPGANLCLLFILNRVSVWQKMYLCVCVCLDE